MSILRVTRIAVQVLYSTSSNLPEPVTFGGRTSLTDRAANADCLEFEPYVDLREPSDQKKISLEYELDPGSPVGLRPLDFHRISGSITTEIDGFRQGVEITSEFYRGAGLGPKIWAGNIKGATNATTLGQGASFTEIQNNKAWTDKSRFDPVAYIGSEPGFNAFGSPVNIGEAPIGDRGDGIRSLEALSASHGISEIFQGTRGNVGDGNPSNFGKLASSNTQIFQTVSSRDRTLVPFTDNNGARYLGHAPAASTPEYTASLSYFWPMRNNSGARGDVPGDTAFVMTGANNGVTWSNGPQQGGTGTNPGDYGAIYVSGATDDYLRGPVFVGGYDAELDGGPNALTIEYLWRPPVTSVKGGATSVHVTFTAPSDSGDSSLPWGILEIENGAASLLAWTHGDTATDVVGMGSAGYGGAGLPEASTSLDRGGWNHICFTQNLDNLVACYINGQLVEQKTLVDQTTLELDSSRKFAFLGMDFDQGDGVFDFTGEGHFADLRLVPGVAFPADQVLTRSNAFFASKYVDTMVYHGSASIGGDGVTPPFDDLGNDKLVDSLSGSATWTGFLKTSGSVNLDGDIREQHGVRSAPAGTDVYGPGQAQYGTDSIAFTGHYRGS